MAKKKPTPQRSESERRARQSQRLARLLKALRCIMGRGRWDADALAGELECSVRTVHRVIATLTMAGVPVRYDSEAKAYRVPPNFKFSGIDLLASPTARPNDQATVLPAAKRLLSDAEKLVDSLRTFCDAFDSSQSVD